MTTTMQQKCCKIALYETYFSLMMNYPESDKEWRQLAKKILKVEMTKKGWSYEELLQALEVVGVKETYASVSNKINRGAFSFIFFLQCMMAMGKGAVTFDL